MFMDIFDSGVELFEKSGGEIDVHPEYRDALSDWKLVRDVYAGEKRVKSLGQEYLPQPTGMTFEDYRAFKERAIFPDVMKQSVVSLTSRIQRHPSRVIWPENNKDFLESCTNTGLSIDGLCRNCLSELSLIGRFGILVDYPNNEVAYNVNPYLAGYTAENILDWEYRHLSSRLDLVYVLLREIVYGRNEKGRKVKLYRYRKLYLNDGGSYCVDMYHHDVSNDKIHKTGSIIPNISGKSLDYIPFVIGSVADNPSFISRSPMSELGSLCLAYYRMSADYQHAMHLSALPTVVVVTDHFGEETTLKLGSGTGWILPIGSSAYILEFTGSTLGQMRQTLLDYESRMALLGADMANTDYAIRNESAETSRMRRMASVMKYTLSANSCDELITSVLKIVAFWKRFSVEECEEARVELNRDWLETKISPPELKALVETWLAGGLSYRSLHRSLQTGEVVPPYTSWEEELELIRNEGK